MSNGNLSGCEIDDGRGNKERRDAAGAVFQKLLVFALDGPEIADAAADVGADAFRDVVANLQSAIVDGLLRSSDGVMNERAHFARFFLFNVVQRIEILYFAREAGRKPGGVELLDKVGTTPPFQQCRPGGLDRVSNRRYQTEARNDDATIQTKLLS